MAENEMYPGTGTVQRLRKQHGKRYDQQYYQRNDQQHSPQQ